MSLIRSDMRNEPGSISTQIFEWLRSADVVICDLTDSNPNVCYELGVVHALNIPVVLIAHSDDDLPFYVRDERVIVTAPAASAQPVDALVDALGAALSPTFAPTSPVGHVFGLSGPFPPGLRAAVHRSAVKLFREDVAYDLRIEDIADGHLSIRFALSYRLFNRTSGHVSQIIGIVPMRQMVPVYGRVGDVELPLDDPDHFTERGWQVSHEFPAESATPVQFVAMVRYRLPDADLFASYLPATALRLSLRYPHDELRIVVEALLPQRVRPQHIAKGVVEYHAPGAVLAYQGFKVDFLPPVVRPFPAH